MTARVDGGLDGVREAMLQPWREDAACADARMPDGTAAGFIDIGAEQAEYVIRRFCHQCQVVGPCSAEGARLAPHAWPTVYGARLWPKGQTP
ncbi:MAG: hypothetical protein LCI03_20605 [Actinobacteria bacterium]|nr:hypothetical protein [Actinomycetota bacterium]